MIDISKLKELVALMAANDLSEVEIKDDKQGISIKRGGSSLVPQVNFAPHGGQSQQSQPAPSMNGAAFGGGGSGAAPVSAEPPAQAIESPMVGTCYLAPNPDAGPFVKVGQNVSADTVVCLIEAMKVFNEIKAEKSGVVEQILVKNGQAVEFGQRMFAVRSA